MRPDTQIAGDGVRAARLVERAGAGIAHAFGVGIDGTGARQIVGAGAGKALGQEGRIDRAAGLVHDAGAAGADLYAVGGRINVTTRHSVSADTAVVTPIAADSTAHRQLSPPSSRAGRDAGVIRIHGRLVSGVRQNQRAAVLGKRAAASRLPTHCGLTTNGQGSAVQ